MTEIRHRDMGGPPRYHFDRSKPFYPLIMAYLMQLHGIKEFAVLGALGTRRTWNLDHLNGPDIDRRAMMESVNKLLAPLELRITGDSERFVVPVEFVSKEFLENYSYLLKYQIQAALSVLVMAHEVTKGQPYRVLDEKWEFLRHCRNAAAHNGHWLLTAGEPRRPAAWRTISLNPSMNNQPLFVGNDRTGSLNAGDPVALLWEIEQGIPATGSAAE
jgi:hypothetical protein